MMPDLKLNAYASLLMNNGIYARLYARYIDGVEIPSTFDSLGHYARFWLLYGSAN
ncbi:MAG: hypothetical protein CM1200mP12_16740 [Gammaproteobacteria bacterium]|nr:MAG: hypothetical protein CM1200mP12_16740 [Gammaproteobacteria bacterium]